MAHLEHVLKLMEGVEHWNVWRAEQPLVKPDLSNVAMGGRNLAGIDFRGARLNGCRFDNAVLTGAVFDGADLQHAILEDAKAEHASFRSADLRHAQMARCNLTGANLAGADLSGAILSGATLAHAYLAGTRINGAQLSGVRLDMVDLSAAQGIESAYFGTSPAPAAAKKPSDPAAPIADAPPDLVVEFGADLSAEQMVSALEALSNFYQACGGAGLALLKPDRPDRSKEELSA